MLVWKAHDAPVFDLAFTPEGRLVTSGNDETIRLWEVGTQTGLTWWTAPKYAPVAVSSDGRHIGHGGYRVGVWSLEGSELLVDLNRGLGVTFAPDGGTFIAHGAWNTPLRRWKLCNKIEQTGGWCEMLTADRYPFFTGGVTFRPDGAVLAAVFSVMNPATERSLRRRYTPVVILWDAESGKEIGRLGPLNKTPPCTHLAFSPGGRQLVGLYGWLLVVWDTSTQTLIARRRLSDRHFKSVTFTPDGRQFLTASRRPNVQVWTTQTWEPTTAYAWNIGNVGCVAVSADGTLAAAGGSTGKVVVWDLE